MLPGNVYLILMILSLSRRLRINNALVSLTDVNTGGGAGRGNELRGGGGGGGKSTEGGRREGGNRKNKRISFRHIVQYCSSAITFQ